MKLVCIEGKYVNPDQVVIVEHVLEKEAAPGFETAVTTVNGQRFFKASPDRVAELLAGEAT
jgi:hypothetical protein